MNDPNKQIRDILFALVSHAARIQTKLVVLKVLDELQEFEEVELLNRASAFFRSIKSSHITDIIVTLDIVFDEKSKRSLQSYLKQTRENLLSAENIQSQPVKDV